MARFNPMDELKATELVADPAVEDEGSEKLKPYEIQLKSLVPLYKSNKVNADLYAKNAQVQNESIKSIMLENKLDAFVVGDIKVSCTTSEKDIMLEGKMIDQLQELKKKKKLSAAQFNAIVKTRLYIDNDALESALYHDKIKPTDLIDCFETKETVSLRLGKPSKSTNQESE